LITARARTISLNISATISNFKGSRCFSAYARSSSRESLSSKSVSQALKNVLTMSEGISRGASL
jgi:hypothetical protein